MQLSDEFYIVGREFEGSFSTDQLRGMVTAGELAPETQVRRTFDDTPMRAVDAGAGNEDPSRANPAAGAANIQHTSGHLPPHQPDDNLVDAEGWSRLPVAPWRRFAARFLDGLIFNAVVGFTVVPLFGAAIFENIILFIIAIVILYMTANSILIGAYTMTPGKKLFGIKVVSLDLKPIGVANALIRESQLFVFGQWLCIPIVSLVGLYLSYRRLRRSADTVWDENVYAVLLKPSGASRDNNTTIGIILMVVLLILGF